MSLQTLHTPNHITFDTRAQKLLFFLAHTRNRLYAPRAPMGERSRGGVGFDAASMMAKRSFNGNARSKSRSLLQVWPPAPCQSAGCRLTCKPGERLRANACSDCHSVKTAARRRTVSMPPSRRRWQRSSGTSRSDAPDESASREGEGAGKASHAHPLTKVGYAS